MQKGNQTLIEVALLFFLIYMLTFVYFSHKTNKNRVLCEIIEDLLAFLRNFLYLSSIKPNVISPQKQQNPQECISVGHSYPSQSLIRSVISRYFPLRVTLRLGSIAIRTTG